MAAWLQAQPQVEAVRHPGLPGARQAALVARYLPRGAGSIFSIDVAGGRPAAQAFVEGLTLFSHLANVGDAKSLVIHPASTTHRQLSDAELAASGIGPGTVRLSVGLEDAVDLLWDLERALAAARSAR